MLTVVIDVCMLKENCGRTNCPCIKLAKRAALHKLNSADNHLSSLATEKLLGHIACILILHLATIFVSTCLRYTIVIQCQTIPGSCQYTHTSCCD